MVRRQTIPGVSRDDLFESPALVVAEEIIGRTLTSRSPEGTTAGIIVETEAYCGVDDKASHAYNGRRTPRNEVMWGPPGHLYIFPIYGIYLCMNIECSHEGDPQAVLIRALEPVQGISLMRERRGLSSEEDLLRLCSGPSKLCQSLGVNMGMNGADVHDGPVTVSEKRTKDLTVLRSKRVGVDYAGDDKDRLRRFVADSRYVSKKA